MFRRRARRPQDDGPAFVLSAPRALTGLIGYRAEAVCAVRPSDGGGRRVSVGVLEMARIPDTTTTDE
ncbi:gas vesicle protein GvpO [Streptomyces sp. BYX5S]